MAKLQLRNTRIYVWLFSFLVLIVPLCIGVGLVFQLNSDGFEDKIISAVSSQLSSHLEEGIERQPVKLLLREIQVPLLLILLSVIAGSALALTLFYRYLIRPMGQMALTACRITEGNLDITMPEYSCCEVNELGRSFNDLSTNLQEVILLVWNYLRDSSMILDRVLESAPDAGQEKVPPPMRQDLRVIREEMRTIEQVITSFNLYDVQIIDQRAMAGANTWQGETETSRFENNDSGNGLN